MSLKGSVDKIALVWSQLAVQQRHRESQQGPAPPAKIPNLSVPTALQFLSLTHPAQNSKLRNVVHICSCIHIWIYAEIVYDVHDTLNKKIYEKNY